MAIDNFYITVTVVAPIVCVAASSLLILLVCKGWKMSNARAYILIYLCLLNMALVWAC